MYVCELALGKETPVSDLLTVWYTAAVLYRQRPIPNANGCRLFGTGSPHRAVPPVWGLDLDLTKNLGLWRN